MEKTPAAERRFFKKSDLGWLLLLAAFSAGLLWFFIPRQTGAQAAIYHENTCLAVYSLSEDRIWSLPEYPDVTFEIRDGAICFSASDCPDQTCVRTGWLRREGAYAVCLPYGLTIKVSGTDVIDDITR